MNSDTTAKLNRNYEVFRFFNYEDNTNFINQFRSNSDTNNMATKLLFYQLQENLDNYFTNLDSIVAQIIRLQN